MIFSMLAGVVLVAAIGLMYYIGASAPRLARLRLHDQENRLRQDFMAAVSRSGKPRGLLWKSLDWTVPSTQPEPVIVRDRETGEILAFAPVTIQFEAVPGSDMEGLPAVGNLRYGSAVFLYRHGTWNATDRTIFNLGPLEAIEHFEGRYVRVGGS